MSRPYGRHINDLPMQQFYPIILAQDARLHHAMEVLGGKPMRDHLHGHPLPPALMFVETSRLRTSARSLPDGMRSSHSCPIKVQVVPGDRALTVPDSPQLE